MTPKSPTPISVTMMLDDVNAGDLKKSSGTIGSGWRLSQSTNSAMSTAAPPRKPSVYGLSQAWLAVLMSPQVSAPRPAVMSTVPTMSRLWVVVSRDSTTAHNVAAAATMPTGTFTQKTADHEKCSTRNPPRSGPMARPRPEMPAQMPMAWGSCLRGKAATMIESESGFRSAPPTPWIARAPISCVSDWARAHSRPRPR